MHARRSPLACLALGATLTMSVFSSLPARSMAGDTRITAHRGSSSAARKNTIASVYAAIGFADLTELNVRATAGGELVLTHNATVNKITNDRDLVRRVTPKREEEVGAGSWFSNAFNNDGVPALQQPASAAFSVDVNPLMEHKPGSAGLFHNVFTQVDLSPPMFCVISSSQAYNNLVLISAPLDLNFEYQPAFLDGDGLSPAGRNRLDSGGADFLSWHHETTQFEKTLELTHVAGMELHVWTVTLPDCAERILNLGINGVTTDNVEVLQTSMPHAASGGLAMVPEPTENLTFAVTILFLAAIGRGPWGGRQELAFRHSEESESIS